MEKSKARVKFGIDYDSPYLARLRFKVGETEYKSEEADGAYLGQLDTGSNTPAMRTKFVKENGFPIFQVKRSFYRHFASSRFIAWHHRYKMTVFEPQSIAIKEGELG